MLISLLPDVGAQLQRIVCHPTGEPAPPGLPLPERMSEDTENGRQDHRFHLKSLEYY